MYDIEIDQDRSLVRIRLGGLMSLEETAAYIAALKEQFHRNRLTAGYLMLIDVSDCTIQSQEMIEAMRGHMATFPKARRIAMVTGSSLARMQIRRLMTQSYAQIFENEAQAFDWLLSDPQRIAEERLTAAGRD